MNIYSKFPKSNFVNFAQYDRLFGISKFPNLQFSQFLQFLFGSVEFIGI